MRIKAALYNAEHLEYGLVSIPYKQPPYSCNRGATYLYWT